MNALIGTPAGSSIIGDAHGHCFADTQKRLFGCAAGVPVCGVHGRPFQSVKDGGTAPSRPSHHGCRSGVIATFVKIVLRWIVSSAFGFVLRLVPGATPKYPASGLMAHKR